MHALESNKILDNIAICLDKYIFKNQTQYKNSINRSAQIRFVSIVSFSETWFKCDFFHSKKN